MVQKKAYRCRYIGFFSVSTCQDADPCIFPAACLRPLCSGVDDVEEEFVEVQVVHLRREYDGVDDGRPLHLPAQGIRGQGPRHQRVGHLQDWRAGQG